MTVIFSKKCELALQAVLYLASQPEEMIFNAKDIADSLKIPKEFVSKILQSLTSSGIVNSKKGKNGGFSIGKKPSEIYLIDIVKAIDGLTIFENCVLGFPDCCPEKPCPVHDEWGIIRDEAFKMLSHYTLEELRDKTIKKIRQL
jgi:Rrf2 family protein